MASYGTLRRSSEQHQAHAEAVLDGAPDAATLLAWRARPARRLEPVLARAQEVADELHRASGRGDH